MIEKYLDAKAVIADLSAETKEEAIGVMVDHLARLGRVADDQAALEAVLARERIMSTSLGHGLAIPHAKVGGLKDFAVCLARSHRGIKYDTTDGTPAKILFLILSPEAKTKDHVKLLAAVTKKLKFAYLRQGVMEAKDAAAIAALFRAG